MKYFEKTAISSKLIQKVTDSRLGLLRNLQKSNLDDDVASRAISSLKSRSRRQGDSLRSKMYKKETNITENLDSYRGASDLMKKTEKAQDYADSQKILRRFYEAIDRKPSSGL